MSQADTASQTAGQTTNEASGDLLEKTIAATRDQQRSYSFDLILDPAKYEHLQRVAELYANSDMVPSHFRGKIENCFIGLQMAVRLGVDPFMFLQKCYVIHGRPAIETQLAVALANSAGVFDGPIRYEMGGEGDGYGCTAWAVHKGMSERCEQQVTIGMAKKMGWWGKKDSLWPKMTGQMLKYRSAMWLIRHECPEVIMGLLSRDEAVDTFGDDTIEVRHAPSQAADTPSHEEQAEALTNPREAPVDPTPKPPKETPAPDDSETPDDPNDAAMFIREYHDMLEAAGNLTDVDEVTAYVKKDEVITTKQMVDMLAACDARRKTFQHGNGSGPNS